MQAHYGYVHTTQHTHYTHIHANTCTHYTHARTHARKHIHIMYTHTSLCKMSSSLLSTLLLSFISVVLCVADCVCVCDKRNYVGYLSDYFVL